MKPAPSTSHRVRIIVVCVMRVEMLIPSIVLFLHRIQQGNQMFKVLTIAQSNRPASPIASLYNLQLGPILVLLNMIVLQCTSHMPLQKTNDIRLMGNHP